MELLDFDQIIPHEKEPREEIEEKYYPEEEDEEED